MKTQFELSTNYNSLFKNEGLSQILTSLDKLEQINSEVFNSINRSIIDKKSRLENLHSRIIRIGAIIKQLEQVPQAITLYSKKFYPENTESYQIKSIYYQDTCDFKLINQKFKALQIDLNSNPSNTESALGKSPDGDMQDIQLSQEILNSLPDYKGIKSELTQPNCPKLFDSEKQDPQTEMLNSLFNYMTRTKVYGEQLETQIKTLNRESQLLSEFMKYKKDSRKNKEKPSDAPFTMMNNEKIKAYKKHSLTLRTKLKDIQDDNFDSKIKQNINLGNVVEIDVMTGHNTLMGFDEGRYEDETNDFPPLEQIFSDDIQGNFELPIDKVRNLKKSQTSNINSGLNAQNQAEQKPTSSQPNPQAQTAVQNQTPGITETKPVAPVIQQTQTPVQNQPKPPVTVPPSIPSTAPSNPPSIPIPSIPVATGKAVEGSGPNIPVPPPFLPSIAVGMSKKKKKIDPKKQAEQDKKNKERQKKIENQKRHNTVDPVRLVYLDGAFEDSCSE